jgi:hypothetical protein
MLASPTPQPEIKAELANKVVKSAVGAICVVFMTSIYQVSVVVKYNTSSV